MSVLLAVSYGSIQHGQAADRSSLEARSLNQAGARIGDSGFSYLYQPADRREPFLSLLNENDKGEVGEASPPGILSKPKSADVKLLGTLSGPEGYSAVIQNSAGRRKIVKSGMVINNKNWKVSEITLHSLVLERVLLDGKQQGVAGSETITLSFSE